jgi:hypothetical protein
VDPTVDIAQKAIHSGLRPEWTYSAREAPSDMTVSKIASEVACTTPTDISAGGSSPRCKKKMSVLLCQKKTNLEKNTIRIHHRAGPENPFGKYKIRIHNGPENPFGKNTIRIHNRAKKPIWTETN